MAKKDNGISGRLFECAVVAIINKENVETLWSSKETTSMTLVPNYNTILNDAKYLVEQYFINAYKAIWNNNPFNDCGDIVLNDNQHIELKYLTSKKLDGKGTYHNTSMLAVERYGIRLLPYFQKYLHPIWNKYKLSYTENGLSLTRQSKQNLKTRSDYKTINNELKEQANLMDNEIRNILYDNLQNDLTLKNLFARDMINKKKSSNEKEKGIPDLYIIFHSTTKTIQSYTKEELSKTTTNIIELIGDYSILLNKQYRITISWQNGLGIQNPTIRVFLE